MAQRILIAGGGHASLPIIKMGEKWKEKGYRTTLISAEPYLVYSGGLPQYMGGFYSFEEITINLKDLSERYGTEFIHDTVASVQSKKNRIITESGAEYEFDILLINIGAKTDVINPKENVYPVKPMTGLLPLLHNLRKGRVKNLLIAGGGAAGTEIALNLSHPHSSLRTKITLFEYQPSILPSLPEKAGRIATAELMKRGVTIKTGRAYSKKDTEMFDAVIDATGNRPASISLQHDLTTSAAGRILTDSTLLALGTQNIFAAGDTADPGGKNYAPIGIHAVKQGPLLRKNISRLLNGQPLASYRPYPINPLILSNGNSDAILTAGGFCARGSWAAILKFVLDINWLEKYTRRPASRRNLADLLDAGFKRAKKVVSWQSETISE